MAKPFYDEFGWEIPWRDATWLQRAGLFLGWSVGAVIVLAMFLGFMWLIATIMDTAAQNSVEHDRCLKQATNGYEIKQCR